MQEAKQQAVRKPEPQPEATASKPEQRQQQQSASLDRSSTAVQQAAPLAMPDQQLHSSLDRYLPTEQQQVAEPARSAAAGSSRPAEAAEAALDQQSTSADTAFHSVPKRRGKGRGSHKQGSTKAPLQPPTGKL